MHQITTTAYSAGGGTGTAAGREGVIFLKFFRPLDRVKIIYVSTYMIDYSNTITDVAKSSRSLSILLSIEAILSSEDILVLCHTLCVKTNARSLAYSGVLQYLPLCSSRSVESVGRYE